MHQYESHEHRDPFRPKAASIEDELSGQFGRAAAAGRTDALGADGLIGLQRAVGNAGVTAMLEEESSSVHDVVRSGGRPLDPDVRQDGPRRLLVRSVLGMHDVRRSRLHSPGGVHGRRVVSVHDTLIRTRFLRSRD